MNSKSTVPFPTTSTTSLSLRTLFNRFVKYYHHHHQSPKSTSSVCNFLESLFQEDLNDPHNLPLPQDDLLLVFFRKCQLELPQVLSLPYSNPPPSPPFLLSSFQCIVDEAQVRYSTDSATLTKYKNSLKMIRMWMITILFYAFIKVF